MHALFPCRGRRATQGVTRACSPSSSVVVVTVTAIQVRVFQRKDIVKMPKRKRTRPRPLKGEGGETFAFVSAEAPSWSPGMYRPWDEQLSEHVVGRVLEFCCPFTLLRFGSVCKEFAAFVRTNNYFPHLWQYHCERLWVGKIYVPPVFLKSMNLRSYFGSIRDSTRRVFYNVEEFAEQHFHFRFRLQAGQYWCRKDTSFRTENPMPIYRRFLPNGLLSNEPPNPATGVNAKYIVRPDYDFLYDDPEVRAFIPVVRWKFTKSKMGRKGLFVKINNFPSLEVRRTQDWGWELDGEWVIYRTCSPMTIACGAEWRKDPRPIFDSDDEEWPDEAWVEASWTHVEDETW